MIEENMDSVKIYFINPIDIISIIIGTLVELQFETYSINQGDREKLLKILPENYRNVIFICIMHKEDVDNWFTYIKKIKSLSNTNTLIGAFVYDKMENVTKNKFLFENVAIIQFSDIIKNTLTIMKKILILFEAKTNKTFVRTKTYGICEAYIFIKNLKDPIKGMISIISAYAFTCHIDPLYTKHFETGAYLDDVLLVLNGTRIKTSLKIMGFSKNNPNIIMLKYVTKNQNFADNIFEGYSETISNNIKKKVYEFIRWCLKEDLLTRIKKIKD